MSDDPTLFEWAGGRQAFDRLINAFYDRVEQDELLSPFFPGGVHEEHRVNVATWWSEVFGGPADYTDQLGGYERMLHKHLQLGITDEQRFRFASLMSLAADDAESARRSRVPLGAGGVPRMGDPTRARQTQRSMPTSSPTHPSSLGLGRGASPHA